LNGCYHQALQTRNRALSGGLCLPDRCPLFTDFLEPPRSPPRPLFPTHLLELLNPATAGSSFPPASSTSSYFFTDSFVFIKSRNASLLHDRLLQLVITVELTKPGIAGLTLPIYLTSTKPGTTALSSPAFPRSSNSQSTGTHEDLGPQHVPCGHHRPTSKSVMACHW